MRKGQTLNAVILVLVLLVAVIGLWMIFKQGSGPGLATGNRGPINNLAIVVGDSAPAPYALTQIKIANALNAPSTALMFESEIVNIQDYNSIILGNPCTSGYIAALLATKDCTVKQKMKLIKFNNGNKALLILGNTPQDVDKNARLSYIIAQFTK